MSAIGPLLKGGLGHGRIEDTVRFPIHERGYTPENRPVEHTAVGGPNDELATTKKGTTPVLRLVHPNKKYR